ncbi:Endoplasmic reticulum-Golgi intermediate compartment protein 2 [Trichoplax sp. H2]|nr:Endoplasmic reticulum-Golgi intermediate compartment protein 2 [Trichoplax sp. H2]|eukprot:RDD46573.1 Endoplasmic reticulum-Golgi intermediate compartment protein 2 [Trichoplax sp. H2]
MLRISKRNRERLQEVKKLDAFPKIAEDCKESSTSGGTASVTAFFLITIMVIMELVDYSFSGVKYNYSVDKDIQSKMMLHLDLTIAMKCRDLGADVLDLASATVDDSEQLIKEDAYFVLTKEQKKWWKKFHNLRKRGSKDSYREVNKILQHPLGLASSMPPRSASESHSPKDACRIHGNIPLNKVAGNFHVTAGMSINHPMGHAHVSDLVPRESVNFSHRIDLLAFGVAAPNVINPLDGVEFITKITDKMYQYFIKIVPTKVKTFSVAIDTYQYSVTEHFSKVDHMNGKHGVSGLFFKYDLSPISVQVTEARVPFGQLLIRLCGIVGGIFATSGMIHIFSSLIYEAVTRRKKLTANEGIIAEGK